MSSTQPLLRQPMIAANWKMHTTTAQATQLIQALLRQLPAFQQLVDDDPVSTSMPAMTILPPFPYLALCQQLLQASQISWGGQNLCAQAAASGAYTGEVSAAMLQDVGCRYVLVGHSERRQYYAENATQLAAKLQHAWAYGLTPIFCIGESLAQREAGDTETLLQKQLATWLALEHNQQQSTVASTAAGMHKRDLVLAYEPIWAIGTGRTASPEQAQATHAFIRSCLRAQDAALAENTRILYGGSVKPANAAALLEQPDVDGALVGGASLEADSLMEIIQSCNH